MPWWIWFAHGDANIWIWSSGFHLRQRISLWRKAGIITTIERHLSNQLWSEESRSQKMMFLEWSKKSDKSILDANFFYSKLLFTFRGFCELVFAKLSNLAKFTFLFIFHRNGGFVHCRYECHHHHHHCPKACVRPWNRNKHCSIIIIIILFVIL